MKNLLVVGFELWVSELKGQKQPICQVRQQQVFSCLVLILLSEGLSLMKSRASRSNCRQGNVSLSANFISANFRLNSHTAMPMPTFPPHGHFVATSMSSLQLPLFRNPNRAHSLPASQKMISAYDFYDLDSDADVVMTTESLVGPCSGKLVMFSQTYLRGDNVTTTVDVQDLNDVNFDDKVGSGFGAATFFLANIFPTDSIRRNSKLPNLTLTDHPTTNQGSPSHLLRQSQKHLWQMCR